MSITELTHKTGTKSESTIVRFYRQLGFDSYHDFKVTLATEIAGNSFYHTFEDITDPHFVAIMPADSPLGNIADNGGGGLCALI